MKPSEMSNEELARYILTMQSEVESFPFSGNEIIRESATRLCRQTVDCDLRQRLEVVAKEIDRMICHPSESNCRKCGYRRGDQCGSISNNEMMKLLKFVKGE